MQRHKRLHHTGLDSLRELHEAVGEFYIKSGEPEFVVVTSCVTLGKALLNLHYSNCSLKVKVKSLSCVQLFVTPWTVAYQAPPSMEFSRQEYWSVLPFPSPGDLPGPGIEPGSPALQADALPSKPSGKPQNVKKNMPYPLPRLS